MPEVYDRVQETSSTAGAGDLTLAGAVTGFRTFTSVLSSGDTCWYTIQGSSSSDPQWEVGIGTFTAPATLSRTTVLASSDGVTPVVLNGLTKQVFITVPAAVATELTDGEDTTLHFHAADRARANHTGTQLAATISDFNSAVTAALPSTLVTAASVITDNAIVIGAGGARGVEDSDITVSDDGNGQPVLTGGAFGDTASITFAGSTHVGILITSSDPDPWVSVSSLGGISLQAEVEPDGSGPGGASVFLGETGDGITIQPVSGDHVDLSPTGGGTTRTFGPFTPHPSAGSINIGTALLPFSSLYLASSVQFTASGGTASIDYSQASDSLTITGADGRVTSPGTSGSSIVTCSATQELDNKTLDSSVGKGTWTASGTWTLPAFTLGGTVSSNGQSFSGTIANLGTVTTIDLNGGTIDGVTIGGSSAGAGTFSSLVATTADINAGTIDNTVIGGATPAAGTFTALQATGNMTVDGDLLVSGSVVTVNVATLEVEDPLIELASNNTAADAVDIGFFGTYDPAGTDLFAGFFRDATDGKWRLFNSLQEHPTTTINISGTGYTRSTLVVGSLEVGADADTTITRVSAGVLAVEGSTVVTENHASWTDLTDGGGTTLHSHAIGNITGLGTNVATALAVAVGSAGAFITFNGAAGTPSSLTLTNATGLPTILVANEATDTSCFLAFFTAATGELGPKTNAGLTYNSNTGDLGLAAAGGNVVIGGGATASRLRMMEPSGSGTNYTEFVVQAQGANITYTLPPDDGDAGEKLTTDGSGGLTWETSAACTIDIFTADDTWSKEAGSVTTAIQGVGGGGGGGGGRRGLNSTNRGGGGGGGGAGQTEKIFASSILGSTESVVVGEGGALGNGATSASTNGDPGTAGEATTFGVWFRAGGGGGGGGGSTVGGTAGTAGTGGTTGGAGGAGSAGGGGTGTDGSSVNGRSGGGGGGGGGRNSSNSDDTAGGAGGDSGLTTRQTPLNGGDAGVTATSNPTDGDSAATNEAQGGGGGGGTGRRATGSTGGAGGGGLYGGGGGGGGSGGSDTQGNDGGNGGDGIFIAVQWT